MTTRKPKASNYVIKPLGNPQNPARAGKSSTIQKKGSSSELDPFAWLNAPETGDLPLKGGYLPKSLEISALN
jgi:hypothetical protein